MFSKLFSPSAKSIPLDEKSQKLISQQLNDFKSELFPEGISPVIQKIEYSQVTLKKESHIQVDISLPFPASQTLSQVSVILLEVLELAVIFNETPEVVAVREHSIKGIKNIVAIASGKGGVGKSTTTVNLAYALQAQGAKVGILDADIYGPSLPTMLGLKDAKPSSTKDNLLIPLEKDGLIAMSIGFLVDESQATVWRGPMASRAFSQLLNETDWPELDYLLIDMPPGTGDIQLTLAQAVPVAAAVVVTTPQDIALIDAVKGIAMFEEVDIPVLGIVENMSYHICDNCGHHSHLFGEGGGEDIAKNFNSKLLGQVPLNLTIRSHADQGTPLISSESQTDSENEITESYLNIAENVAGQLFLQLDMRSSQTAEIVIDDSPEQA